MDSKQFKKYIMSGNTQKYFEKSYKVSIIKYILEKNIDI